VRERARTCGPRCETPYLGNLVGEPGLGCQIVAALPLFKEILPKDTKSWSYAMHPVGGPFGLLFGGQVDTKPRLPVVAIAGPDQITVAPGQSTFRRYSLVLDDLPPDVNIVWRANGLSLGKSARDVVLEFSSPYDANGSVYPVTLDVSVTESTQLNNVTNSLPFIIYVHTNDPFGGPSGPDSDKEYKQFLAG